MSTEELVSVSLEVELTRAHVVELIAFLGSRANEAEARLIYRGASPIASGESEVENLSAPDEEPMTITRAAEMLDKTPQRVSQMLREGKLQGPPLPEGKKASPNAGRIWPSSVQQRLLDPGQRQQVMIVKVVKAD